MYSKLRVIGLAGPAGVGKTTLADELVEKLGYERMSFATALKEFADAMVSTEDVGGISFTAPLTLMDKTTARPWLVAIGAGARKAFGEDFWINCFHDRLLNKLEGRWNEVVRVVVDDVRYPNEVEYIENELGGFVTFLRRDGIKPANPEEERSLAEVEDVVKQWFIISDDHERCKELFRFSVSVLEETEY